MRVLLLVALLSLVSLTAGSTFNYDNQKQELFVYREKIKILQKHLTSRCPHESVIDLDKLPGDVTAVKELYNKLVKDLFECRKANPTPRECLTATNLTESWRMDHSGSNILPGGPHSIRGYACDFHKDLQWFRFSGSAGNRMLNKCPPSFSCGTFYPLWTDEEAPTEVGVADTINVYASAAPNYSCKYYTNQVKVMRCSLSTEHDLIYKYIGGYYDNCGSAFCGMK